MKAGSLLLVDDDLTFRQVIGNELKRLGYRIDSVGTGEEGGSANCHRRTRCGVAGRSATRNERSRCAGIGPATAPAIEVVMLTGHGSIDTAIKSTRIGAFDYVVKPCPLAAFSQCAVKRR